MTTTIAESETISPITLNRVRDVILTINESLAYFTAIGRNRSNALSISEAETYVATVQALRGLSWSIAESDLPEGSTTLNRSIVAALSELESISLSLITNAPHGFAFSITEGLSIQSTLGTRRAFAAEVDETETVSPRLIKFLSLGFNTNAIEDFVLSVSRIIQVGEIISEGIGFDVVNNVDLGLHVLINRGMSWLISDVPGITINLDVTHPGNRQIGFPTHQLLTIGFSLHVERVYDAIFIIPQGPDLDLNLAYGFNIAQQTQINIGLDV